MKKAFLMFAAIVFVWSCTKEKTSGTKTSLTGEWKLIEVLADPGDGSGSFNPVTSSKTVTFDGNGVILSNGRLCDMSINADTPTSGTYSVAESKFTSADCSNPEYGYTFEQTGDILIITYPCIEPCKAKFRKQ